MKIILLLLLSPTLCFAQQIAAEQIPAQDILNYVGINPDSVAFRKFSIAFPSPKFVALEYQKLENGKAIDRHLLPLGPSMMYRVEVFLLPFDKNMRMRSVRYKLSTEQASFGSSATIEIPEGTEMSQFALADSIPTVLSYSAGKWTYRISILISDTTIR